MVSLIGYKVPLWFLTDFIKLYNNTCDERLAIHQSSEYGIYDIVQCIISEDRFERSSIFAFFSYVFDEYGDKFDINYKYKGAFNDKKIISYIIKFLHA